MPSDSEIEGWLRRAGGPVTGAEIGLSDDEVAQGIACGHYYRNRFTVGKLSWMLGDSLTLTALQGYGCRYGGGWSIGTDRLEKTPSPRSQSCSKYSVRL